MGKSSGKEGLGKAGNVGVEVIRVAANSLSPDDQREGDGAFGGWGVAAGEVEVLLEVDGFDLDKGVDMIMIQVHIESRNVTREEEYPNWILQDSGCWGIQGTVWGDHEAKGGECHQRNAVRGWVFQQSSEENPWIG